MKEVQSLRYPYTETCEEQGHRRHHLNPLACASCQCSDGAGIRNSTGNRYTPAKTKKGPCFPYTANCEEQGHKHRPGGKGCVTCQAVAAAVVRHSQHPQPADTSTLPAQTDSNNGNGHHSDATESWEAWATQMIDAFILQSHYVPASADPFRPGFVQDLISRRPR